VQIRSDKENVLLIDEGMTFQSLHLETVILSFLFLIIFIELSK